MRLFMAFIGVYIIFLIWVTQAYGQGSCRSRVELIAWLAENHLEQLRGLGIRNEQQIIEVWVNPEARTWSVLMTRSDGLSCLMASGTDWRELDPLLGEEG